MSLWQKIPIAILLIGLLSSQVYALEAERVGVLSRVPASMLREEPYLRQCELGSAVADAVRDFAGTEIALINMGDLANDLPDGDITRAEVENVFAEDRALVRASIPATVLRAILEHSVARVTVDDKTEQVLEEESRFDGFCQVSGISFTYDATAPAGERVLRISRQDGAELGDEVTVCATAYMMNGGYGYPAIPGEPVNGTLSNALAAYISGHSSFPASEKERITVVGVRVPLLGTGLTRGTLFAGSLVLIGFLAYYRMRRKNYQEEYSETEMDSDIEALTRASFYRRKNK